jgi:hypothetical protein
MRILSFDQAVNKSCAVTLEEKQEGKLRIVEWSNGQFGKTSGIHRLAAIRAWLQECWSKCSDTGPDLLVREMHNQRQFGAASQLQVVGGMIDLMAFDSELVPKEAYAIITAGTWKKFCLGKGNLKKDTSYMLHLNKFFQNTRYLSVDGSFEVHDDNLGDAICLGICAYVAWRIKNDLPAFVTDVSKFKHLKTNLPTVFGYGNR